MFRFVLLFDGRMLLSDWHLVSGCGRGYNRPLSLIPRQSHHHIQPMHNVLFEQYDGITITANPWSLNRHHHLHFQLLWIAVGIFSITHLHFMQRPPFSYFPRIKKSLIIIFFNSLLRPNLFLNVPTVGKTRWLLFFKLALLIFCFCTCKTYFDHMC